MNPTRINPSADATAAMVSRRQILGGLGGAALAGIAWPDRSWGDVARPRTRAPSMASTVPWIAPDMVSPLPIPLGGNRFLMNGRVVAVDLELAEAAFRDGVSAVPVVVDEATYDLTPALVARAAQIATPVAANAQPAATPLPLAEGAPRGETLESVCGALDDSEDVELYRGDLLVSKEFVANHQSMVGVLRWEGTVGTRYANPGNVTGRRWCSGTLIADDLFLTAGHCLSPYLPGWDMPKINGTDMVIQAEEIATNMKVEFDYQLDGQGNDRPPQPFEVIELVEQRWLPNDWDYAIVRLAGDPGKHYGKARLAAIDPPINSRVCVIGHPEAQPKRVAAGTTVAIEATRISYSELDTLGGSSGSGVLATPNGPLVGIHIAGDCDDSGAQKKVNYGMRIASLLGISPMLKKLCCQ